jgi:molybdate transport system substrate-binding protein
MLISYILRAVAVFVVPMTALATASMAEEITVAAGAGYRRPLAEVAAAFEKSKGDRVLQVYGNMGQVLAQTRESEKISVVCGDQAVLKKAKGVSFDRMLPLGKGRLVVAYRKGMTLAKPQDIANDTFKRIGIPDQTNAIYGKAGRQFLAHEHLAEKVDPKLIAVATVPQVAGYVASGEVDAGFMNATAAIAGGDNFGGFVEVDPKLYEPIEIACGIVTAAKDSATADSFAKFLGSEPARAILARYGL